MRPITRVASIGVNSPSLTAVSTLPAASDASSALGLLVGLVIMTSTLEPTLDAMLPAIAVALLTPLYGYFFKILGMQLD